MIKYNYFSWKRMITQHNFLQNIPFFTDRGVGPDGCSYLTPENTSKFTAKVDDNNLSGKIK